MHEGVDEDNDNVPDGIKVWEFWPDDPAGTWRTLWTATDSCGPRWACRRTHDPQRMMVANQTAQTPFQASNYDQDQGWLYWGTTPSALKAAQKQRATKTWRPSYFTNAPARTASERLAGDWIFWFAGHGDAHCFNFDPEGGAAKGVLTYGNHAFPTENYYLPPDMSRLWFFGGTGCTSASGTDNIISQARQRNAQGVLGWTSSPEGGKCGEYSELLWHYLMEDFLYFDSSPLVNKWKPTWPTGHAEAAAAALAELKRRYAGNDHGFQGVECYGTNRLLMHWDFGFTIREPKWPQNVPAPSNRCP